MPLSTDVNLPKKHKAKFPDRCVVCVMESPNSTAWIANWTKLSWGGLRSSFSRRFAVNAPACKGCRWVLQQRRVSGLLLFFVLVGIGIWYVLPRIEQIDPDWLQKFAFIGMLVVCMIPYLIVEICIPKPFNIWVYEDSVAYEFRDHDYAYDFAELNEDAEWVTIS